MPRTSNIAAGMKSDINIWKIWRRLDTNHLAATFSFGKRPVFTNCYLVRWSLLLLAACCHGAKLCAHAARDFRSQHYCLFRKRGKAVVKPYSEREDIWQFCVLYSISIRLCFSFKDFSFLFVSRADFIIRVVAASTLSTFEQQPCVSYTYVRHRRLSSAVYLGNGQRHAHSGYTYNTVIVSEHTVSRGKTSMQLLPHQGGQQ